MMNRVRGRTGQEMVGKNGAMRKLLRRLKKGGGAALLVDQNVLPRDGGEFVHLFGLPVPTTRAAGILMERANASIAFCYCTADDSGTYYVRGLPPLSVGETRDSGRHVTQWIVEMIERVIRENPGRWLWMYKRWKYVPEGISRERYPFYAKPAPATDSSRRQRQQGGGEA
jgi:KDO2-lipid IV(A) lauroyltransferase